MYKGKRKPKRHAEFTSSYDNLKTFFNVISCDIEQPIRYLNLFTNWYINSPLKDFWKKFNSVQQLQKAHM